MRHSPPHNRTTGPRMASSGTSSRSCRPSLPPAEKMATNEPITANHATITADNLVVIGSHNTIQGNNLTVRGHHNKIVGDNARVTGNHNRITGSDHVTIGNHNITISGGAAQNTRRIITLGSKRGGLGNTTVNGPQTLVNSIGGSVAGSIVFGSDDTIVVSEFDDDEKKN